MKLSLQDLDADLGGVIGMVLRDGVQGKVHEALAGGCLGVAAGLAGRLEAQLEADVGLLRGQLAQLAEELAAAGGRQGRADAAFHVMLAGDG